VPFPQFKAGITMIRHTIEISQNAAHLAAKHKQLLLKRRGDTTRFFPFEDLGLVIVDHPAATYSHAALRSLVDANAALVVCGKNHLPAGLLLPLGDHTEIVWRTQDQINAPKPLQKQLWKQIVQAKIRAQADNLPSDGVARRKMLQLARSVKSGDTSNHEAQAARIYWSEWLEDTAYESTDEFRRARYGPAPNPLLNYGYAILRAATARAIVAAGLLPMLGIQHSNRSNSFCLADDLMEPLRPLVDRTVRELVDAGQVELTPETKRPLLEILTAEVETGDRYGPLMVALHSLAVSLVKCFRKEEKVLQIPKPVRPGKAQTQRNGSDYRSELLEEGETEL
jgi:CRISP-associated protein Cas1